MVNAEMFRDPTYQDSVERYNVVYRKQESVSFNNRGIQDN